MSSDICVSVCFYVYVYTYVCVSPSIFTLDLCKVLCIRPFLSFFYVCVSVCMFVLAFFPFVILSVMLAVTWYFLNVAQGTYRRTLENSQQMKRDYFCESKRIKKRRKGENYL